MGKLIGIARATKPRTPMEEMDSVSISVDGGLEGDRRGKLEGAQVTILAREDWEAACREVETDLPWTTRRANLFVEGLVLPREDGTELKIGDVRLVVRSETDPCNMMEKAQSGLRAALTPEWRGGIRCDVLEGGTVTVGASADLA